MSVKSRFRPHVESLEGREVPASFSFQLSDFTTGSGQFDMPEGVDSGQSTQSIVIDDLIVLFSDQTLTGADLVGNATAEFEYGVFVGVTADYSLSGGGTYSSLSIADGVATAQTGTSTPTGTVAYDTADVQADFTLVDGTVGTLSYDIPWEAIDPNQPSQSLALANFRMNIAGQNFTEANADFTTLPTAQFENGVFVGLTFAINFTPGIGVYQFTSLWMDGNLDLVQESPFIGAFSTLVEPRLTQISVDFSNAGGNMAAYDLTIKVYYKAAGATKTVTFEVAANETGGGLRDAVYGVLKDAGVVVELSGENRLIVKGTRQNQFTGIEFTAAGNPPITNLKSTGLVKAENITPFVKVNGVNK